MVILYKNKNTTKMAMKSNLSQIEMLPLEVQHEIFKHLRPINAARFGQGSRATYASVKNYTSRGEAKARLEEAKEARHINIENSLEAIQTIKSNIERDMEDRNMVGTRILPAFNYFSEEMSWKMFAHLLNVREDLDYIKESYPEKYVNKNITGQYQNQLDEVVNDKTDGKSYKYYFFIKDKVTNNGLTIMFQLHDDVNFVEFGRKQRIGDYTPKRIRVRFITFNGEKWVPRTNGPPSITIEEKEIRTYSD